LVGLHLTPVIREWTTTLSAEESPLGLQLTPSDKRIDSLVIGEWVSFDKRMEQVQAIQCCG